MFLSIDLLYGEKIMSLCLVENHVMKTLGEVELQVHHS
jgi:hypothetical protein